MLTQEEATVQSNAIKQQASEGQLTTSTSTSHHLNTTGDEEVTQIKKRDAKKQAKVEPGRKGPGRPKKAELSDSANEDSNFDQSQNVPLTKKKLEYQQQGIVDRTG